MSQQPEDPQQGTSRDSDDTGASREEDELHGAAREVIDPDKSDDDGVTPTPGAG